MEEASRRTRTAWNLRTKSWSSPEGSSASEVQDKAALCSRAAVGLRLAFVPLGAEAACRNA